MNIEGYFLGTDTGTSTMGVTLWYTRPTVWARIKAWLKARLVPAPRAIEEE